MGNLDNDYYHFDNERHLLIGENSRRVYRLGDKVRVKVRSVDLDERKIDLKLLAAESPSGKDRMSGSAGPAERRPEKRPGKSTAPKSKRQQKREKVGKAKAKRAKVEQKRKAKKQRQK